MIAANLMIPLATALMALPSFAYHEIAHDELTCNQLTQIVKLEKRYYVRTAKDGIVPIYPVIPVTEFVDCPRKMKAFYHVLPTLDVDECHVGFSCDPT